MASHSFELIVVIAIIGILAGILVPSLVGYMHKANRRVDATNAKVMHDDFSMLLYTDESTYPGYLYYGHPADLTPMQSFVRIAGGSTGRTSKGINAGTAVHVNARGGGIESYRVYIICYMDGAYFGQKRI